MCILSGHRCKVCMQFFFGEQIRSRYDSQKLICIFGTYHTSPLCLFVPG